MGLLDDAIREHLDLKRRRGADPAEVARLEQEALGPVRREPVAEPTAAEPAEAEPAEAEHPHVLAPEERHEPPHGDALMGGAAQEPKPGAADADRAGGAGETTSAAPPAESSSPATGPARSSAEPDPVDQPTTEYRVEDEHEDDVLEETPDFLQETPEHDRLWFEQRPPRDFDFDG
ncbi:MAG: hypothetical protein ACTHOE_11715 [Conexibacter sp.]